MSANTLANVFAKSVKANATRPALRWKRNSEWRQMTYADLESRVRDFAHGLMSLGVRKGDRVAIFSRNSPEWAITDWANVTSGFVTIPIYDTLTAEKAAYILKDAAAKVVVVQSREHLDKVRSVRRQLPMLKFVVNIEEIIEGKLRSEDEAQFDDLYKMGAEHGKKNPGAWEKAAAAVRPEDTATIIYTSGTTGEPKGAVATHANVTSNVRTVIDYVGIGPNDSNLSFLPLSHVFERVGGHFTFIAGGATIAYAESIEKVPENLLEVRPTILISVPRLYEKMYARIQERIRGQSFLKRFIFRRAMSAGKQYIHQKYTLKVENPSTTKKYKRYDRLVFSKLRERVGGRLRFAVSGGAPLSPEIHEFFTVAGIPIFQGYGLTETPTAVAVNRFSDFRIGSVGKILPGCDVKIAEDGEILVKAPNVFQGYYNKPEATQEAFTKDGYFRTGDIGRLDEDGFLYITDRKKELIVLSNGKKVAPQPIENELKTKPGVGQAVLIGNQKNYITALLWPDFEALKTYAGGHGIKFGDQKELVTRDHVLKLFEKGVGEVNERLARYEQIKRYKVLESELVPNVSPELTPTLKIKRRVVDEKYAPVIQSLYTDGGKAE